MKKLTVFGCLFLLFTFPIFAQQFEMPEDFTLEVKEDYTKYEQKIIEASKWLQAVPLNEQKETRQRISYLVVKWVNGSPTVNVEITPVIIDFEEKNKGMLVLYMATCSQYVLENNYSKDMRAKHKYALKAMMTVYQSGKGIKKDKKMDKLIKADAEGKLDEWLEENLKINPL